MLDLIISWVWLIPNAFESGTLLNLVVASARLNMPLICLCLAYRQVQSWLGLACTRLNHLLYLVLTRSSASPLRCVYADTCQLNAPENSRKLYSYI